MSRHDLLQAWIGLDPEEYRGRRSDHQVCVVARAWQAEPEQIALTVLAIKLSAASWGSAAKGNKAREHSIRLSGDRVS